MIRRLLPFAPLLLAAAPAHATDHDAQLWVATSARILLDERIELLADAGARFSNDRDGLYATYIRAALAYQLSDTVSLAAGFNHVDGYAGRHHASSEERPFEELDIALGHGFDSRTRLEQRFYPGQTGWRLREKIGWAHPIGHRLRLSLGSEAFFALDDAHGEDPGFNRLRTMASVSMPIDRHLALSLGYVNQWSRRSGADEAAHAATLTLAAHF